MIQRPIRLRYGLVLGDENRVAQPFVATHSDFHGVDNRELKTGQPVADWNPDSWLRSATPRTDGDPDDLLGEHLGLPVLSPRLQAALQQADIGQNDIQFLPVKVVFSTGEVASGYAIANIITRLPALDREHSFLLEEIADKIDPLTGQPKVLMVGRCAVFDEILLGHDAIRLQAWTTQIVVSQRFVRIFTEGRFTGATFQKLIVAPE